MHLTSYGWAMIALVAFSVWMTRSIIKRLGTKSGCFGFVYIFLVVFCVGLFTIGITTVAADYLYKKSDILLNGKTYSAKVIDYKEVESTDDEGTSYNYYPIYEFTLDNGQTITRTSDETTLSELKEVGIKKDIFYHAGHDQVTSIGATTVLVIFAIVAFLLLFGFSFVGIIMYGTGCKMDGYINACKIVGLGFFIPMLMIGFDALLIFAYFYGNVDQAWFIKPLLIFFIIMLSLGTFGYIKMLITEGIPKFTRTSATTWEGEWESDDDEDYEDEDESEDSNDIIRTNK